MGDRAYILLDIATGKAEQATEVLRESPGVVMADALEGPPDVIIVMEALNRQQLTKLTIQALSSVETITEHAYLLPARDTLNATDSPKLSRRIRGNVNKRSSKRLRHRTRPN